MSGFYGNMYGGNKTTPQTPKSEEPKPVAPAHQRLSGLKITSSHMFAVDIGGKQVTIPSVAYVKLLEDQIKDFRSQMHVQKSHINRLTNEINRLSSEIDKMNQSMVRKR